MDPFPQVFFYFWVEASQAARPMLPARVLSVVGGVGTLSHALHPFGPVPRAARDLRSTPLPERRPPVSRPWERDASPRRTPIAHLRAVEEKRKARRSTGCWMLSRSASLAEKSGGGKVFKLWL